MSTTTNDRVAELMDLAQGAARRVAGSWPDAIEADDLAQEIVIRLLESPGALDRIFAEDEPTRRAFCIKVGHQIAAEMFRDYERFSGNYTYDTAVVRSLLDSGAILAEGDSFVVEHVDLREALTNVLDSGSNYYAEIVNRYVHEIVPDSKDSAAKMRLSRAVESLTAHMNRIGAERRKNYTEGPGTRSAITNTRAIAVTADEGAEPVILTSKRMS